MWGSLSPKHFFQQLAPSFSHRHSGLNPDLSSGQCGGKNEGFGVGETWSGATMLSTVNQETFRQQLLFLSLSVICKRGQAHSAYWWLGESNEKVCV